MTVIIMESNLSLEKQANSHHIKQYEKLMIVVPVCLLTRFRQEAAVLLDILSLYQKRQIVEFLPYHYCDMTNQQSPDLKCVMTLQAQCTEYRHMIVLIGTWSFYLLHKNRNK